MSNARNLANLLGTSTQIKTAKVADEVFQANESLIINGDFSIAQRGTSISIAHDGNSANRNAYLLDRFLNSMNSAYDTFDGTLAQVSDAPEGFSNSLKWTTGTAEAAVDSNEYHNISHKIEAQNLQHLKYGTSDAKSVTVSFWVKASVTGTFCLSIYQADGVRNITSTYTINSANTWEYKTVTFAGDTGGTINDDNGEGLRLQWHISAGSDLTSTDATSWGAYSGDRWAYGHAQNAIATTASATFQLAGCKMEVGSVATPFRHESYGDNLAKCQRYFEKVDTGYWTPVTLGQAFQNRKKIAPIHWKVSKRATPTCPDITLTIDGGDGTHLFTASEITKDAVGYTSSTSSPSIGTSDIAFIDAADTITADAEL